MDHCGKLCSSCFQGVWKSHTGKSLAHKVCVSVQHEVIFSEQLKVFFNSNLEIFPILRGLRIVRLKQCHEIAAIRPKYYYET